MKIANVMRHGLVFLVVALTTWSGLVTTSVAGVCLHKYDPGLGTLPSAQGWFHNSNGLPETNYSLVSGCLVQGDTAPNANVQNYQVAACVTFDFMTDGVKATARLKIISSGFLNNRAGWNIQLTDGSGRFVQLFVGASEVFLLGTNADMTALLLMDTTDKVHVYELLVQDKVASLWIDGSKTVLSLTLSQFGVGGGSPDHMFIGDGTNGQPSSSELKGFNLCVNCEILPVHNTSWGKIKALFE